MLQVILWALWMRVVAGEVASSHDISQINSLGGPEGRLPSIDPRLRKALLRVLTRLEDEDRRTNQDSARQMVEAMQNIVSEQDFIRYFQEQGLEKELLESYGTEQPNKEDQKDPSNYGEILSYSSEDEKRNSVTPFTFASYPEDKTEVTSETQPEYQQDKYPATNPTPSLGDAVYFQIPEPVHFSESADNEDKLSFNVQETRSIQGPTLVSPTENTEYQTEKILDEQKLNFISEDISEKGPNESDNAVNIIRVAELENVSLPKEGDEAAKTEIDFPANNGTEIEDVDDSGNSSMKVKLEKHEVEFLHSSLLAAFTVQQDQQGLPRRVIPLNYQASGDAPIPLPKNKELLGDSQNGVENKHKQLELQVKFLQEQQLQEEQYQRLQEFVKERQRLIDDESQRQQLLENQKRVLGNDQRLALARQRQQQILFQNQQFDNELDTLKELERQRLFQQQQQQLNYQQQQFQQSHNYQQPQSFPQQQIFQQQPVQQHSFQQQPIHQQSFQQQPVHQQGLQQKPIQQQSFQQQPAQLSSFQQQSSQQQSFQQQPVQQQSFLQQAVSQHGFQQQPTQQQTFQTFQQQNPQTQTQHVNFQKSVDFQFQTSQQQPQTFSQSSFQPSFNSAFQPSVQLNRVNRHEPSNSIGNFGLSTPQPVINFHSSGVSTGHNFIQPTHSSFSTPSNYLQPQSHHRFIAPRPPLTVDSQIQSLLSISGISQDLRSKPSAQEDLNIVSKVLALGHGDQFTRQQFQASTIHEQFVLPPSRVIEPPKLWSNALASRLGQ